MGGSLTAVLCGCQLYTVFVFANGGRDLEHCVLNGYDEARSVLFQVRHPIREGMCGGTGGRK